MFHKKFIPSPAMVVAIVAVVLALGGTGFAATGGLSHHATASKSKSSSDTKADTKLIKKLAPKLSVKSAKSALTAATAANAANAANATHAASADNATNATNAANATHATNADNATKATSAGTVDQIKTWFATASIGQTVTLLTIGPFTYTGECTAGSPSGAHAQTFVTTSQDGSVADSYAAESGYTIDQKDPWNAADGKLSIGYASNEHETGGTDANPDWAGPYDGSDTQISGDGHTYVNTFASVGTKFHGADCTFVGHAIVQTM